MMKVKAAAFDLDGTIYLGDTLMEGVMEVLGYLKEINVEPFYFTNNSSKTREDIFNKLTGLGIRTELKKVYNSAYAAGLYLKKNAYMEVYCMGSAGLKKEIENAGVKCVSEGSSGAGAVVVGLDSAFDYKKLAAGINMLKNGCSLIICNRDRTFPVENGRILPGCGPIAAALENACGRKADVTVGKPDTFMLEILCSDWGYEKSDIVVVGDTYDSDILMAQKFGSPSVFIGELPEDAGKTEAIREIKGLIGLLK
jgi:HAD superfamily hydrolase (TIGR01450 family)